ncbi:hypothetical protein ERJ75_001375300 [Trypanosoma vivax]|nr:hypothetical protein ERJ75_001375300 [Trypanosoma vivax]
MTERIDTVFKKFGGLVNVSAERAVLEEDDTFTNSLEAREVVRCMRSKLETAGQLTNKLESAKAQLLAKLEKGDAVVGDLNDALLSISIPAGGFARTQRKVVSIRNVT